jgi:glycyl-tRNA synthetase
MPDLMETIASLAKHRGIAFPSSEIYGGLRSSWDYGPLGTEMRRNIRNRWWRDMVQMRDDVVGLEAAIIMSPRVWEASGHVAGFSDPLVECRTCHQRFRADHLEEAAGDGPMTCPHCGEHDFTEAKQFNLMFQTHMGPVEDDASVAYLRPETAQGMFVDYRTVQQAARQKVPFGIAQIGRSFRNEITPGNFIFRTREFEQMEMEFFVEPGTDDTWFEYWLRAHQEASGEDLTYFDQEGERRYLPYVIEPAVGVDRILLTLLLDAYRVDEAPTAKGGTDKRTVLGLHRDIAPIKVAVLPLSRNEALVPEAKRVHDLVKPLWMTSYDDAGAIGRRYRRQDEVGTPFCVTVDFDSLEDRKVTVRERDSMHQDRIAIDALVPYLREVLP